MEFIKREGTRDNFTVDKNDKVFQYFCVSAIHDHRSGLLSAKYLDTLALSRAGLPGLGEHYYLKLYLKYE